LLIRGPGIAPGTRLPNVARTVDLFPTIAEMMGLSIPEEAKLSGESLAPVLRGEPGGREPVSYAESLVPLLHFGWSDLRSIRRGNWKYIQAPRPELYDLSVDPMEISNLAESRPDLVRGMRGALGEELDRERAAASRSSGKTESVPQELLDKLGALGYIGAGAPASTSSPGADPKDKIEEFRTANALIREGILLFHEGKYAESVDRYRKLLAIPVESFEVHFYLARGLLALERNQEAAPHFEQAVGRLPTHVGAWEGLAQSLSVSGDLSAAIDALRRGQAAIPEDAGFHQREGAILLGMGKPAEARAAYEKAIELAPKDALLRARFGELLRDLGEVEESIQMLREATEIDSKEASYWNSLGMTLGGNGRLAEGEEAFRRAFELEGENARYAFNLGLILMRQNRPAEARPFFEAALRIEPRFEEARRFLAEIDRE
ncbi:MAG: tetratricopeptide repeat protein, partial [Vicinamibacteria bacterium]